MDSEFLEYMRLSYICFVYRCLQLIIMSSSALFKTKLFRAEFNEPLRQLAYLNFKLKKKLKTNRETYTFTAGNLGPLSIESTEYSRRSIDLIARVALVNQLGTRIECPHTRLNSTVATTLALTLLEQPLSILRLVRYVA